MKKYVEVIIKNKKNNQRVINRVAKGYAFNYLIPNQLAELATKKRVKHLMRINYLLSQKKDQINKLSQKISHDIMNIGILHVRKKNGNNYQIFGSVSEQDIQGAILEVIGEKIDKKRIQIDNIKQIGTYTCYISINEEIKTPIRLHILPHSI